MAGGRGMLALGGQKQRAVSVTVEDAVPVRGRRASASQPLLPSHTSLPTRPRSLQRHSARLFAAPYLPTSSREIQVGRAEGGAMPS